MDMACPLCKGSHHVHGHHLLSGVACCLGRHSGPFWSLLRFLTMVRLPGEGRTLELSQPFRGQAGEQVGVVYVCVGASTHHVPPAEW